MKQNQENKSINILEKLSDALNNTEDAEINYAYIDRRHPQSIIII
jgi:hypothetical protein